RTPESRAPVTSPWQPSGRCVTSLALTRRARSDHLSPDSYWLSMIARASGIARLKVSGQGSHCGIDVALAEVLVEPRNDASSITTHMRVLESSCPCGSTPPRMSRVRFWPSPLPYRLVERS